MSLPPLISSSIRGIVRVYDRARIGLMDFEKNPPVFVLTSGKVGSSSAYYSLKAGGIRCFHVHGLVRGHLDRVQRNTDPEHMPRHLGVSQGLVRKMSQLPSRRWNIITLVREPVGQLVSGVCQNYRRFGLVRPGGGMDVDAALAWLGEKAADSSLWTYGESWFKRELEEGFGIDVFDSPFDPAKGYQVIENERARVLLFRLENLDQTFAGAVQEFFGLPEPCELAKANVGGKKDYAGEYDELKQRFRLSPEAERSCRESAIVSHFYPDREAAIMAKWIQHA